MYKLSVFTDLLLLYGHVSQIHHAFQIYLLYKPTRSSQANNETPTDLQLIVREYYMQHDIL